jgi:hypothetical protein
MMEDENEGEWTLRRASAWALDCLSNYYCTEVLDIVAPIISVIYEYIYLIYRIT